MSGLNVLRLKLHYQNGGLLNRRYGKYDTTSFQQYFDCTVCLKIHTTTGKIHFETPLKTIRNKNCKLIVKFSYQNWKHAKAKSSRSSEHLEGPNWIGEWNPETIIRWGSDLQHRVKKSEFFIWSNEQRPSPSKRKN